MTSDMTPVLRDTYRFNSVPLTDKERKSGIEKRAKGLFRYTGRKGKSILIFQESAHVEDGVIYAGRRIAMTQEDFALGMDMGKIRGRLSRKRK